jgi:osmotically-inducible protein OsmY
MSEMGSLTKRSTDLLERVPGLRRGPTERVRQKGKRTFARARSTAKKTTKTTAKATGALAAVGTGASAVWRRGRSIAESAGERLSGGSHRPRWRRRAGVAAGAGTAAGAAYFLDPNSGKRRRHGARDRIAALVRRGGRKAERAGSYGAHTAAGKARGAAASAAPTETPSDETLADRVRSVVLRPEDAPKGEVNINVVDGVVYLRGEVDESDRIRSLVEATEKVDGVRRVESLLHTPA